MDRKINILFISSEAMPYAKTGGLGDVAGALPGYLKKLGANVKSFIPLYGSINREKYKINKLFDGACVKMGNCQEFYSVWHTTKPSGSDFYFIEFDKYFNRPGIYNDAFAGDYKDNAYRYSFLVRTAMQSAKDMGFRPDIIHVSDWQTAIACYYVKHDNDSFFKDTKTVLTIHNIGYQGVYGVDVLPYAGISPFDFNENAFEAYGSVNLLKAGIHFADKVTTVSPTYAKEILSEIGAQGLHKYLRERYADLVGILNGCDTNVWNPSKDAYIPYNYDVNSYKQGKAVNKKALQQMFWLEERPDLPVFSFAARMTRQKGVDLLIPIVEKVINTMACQMIFLGSGDDKHAEGYLGGLPARYPGRIGAFIGHSEDRVHFIEAGSDFFIMPSLYEPCGLNQMYSQIYGTLPIVRATGGLDDTVNNYNEQTGKGTGFKFWDISSEALYNTVGWANSTYWDRPEDMDKMIHQAMSRNFSWTEASKNYIKLYEDMLK